MRICIIKILSYRHKNIKYSYIEYFEEAKFCFNIKNIVFAGYIKFIII